MIDDDPFAEDPLQRDQWGRPLIIPVKRGKPDLKAKRIGYTRASTFCSALDNGDGLTKWRLWCLALGLAHNPDLVALAGIYGPRYSDIETDRAAKRELNDIIERAHDRAGGNIKADYGTVIHALTEPDPLGFVPDTMADDVAAYQHAMTAAGLEVVATEQFVVCDELQVAGTYDHRVQATRDIVFDDGVTIAAGTILTLDKKTGKLHFDSQSIQLAVYANSKTYDPETGERGDVATSADYAVLAHIPAGAKRADLYRVDIRIGWAAAKIAFKAREHTSRKDIGTPFPTVQTSEPAPAAETAKLGAVIVASEQQIAENARLFERAAQVASTVSDAEGLATVTELLGATPVSTLLQRLGAATSKDELSALWREDKAGPNEWTDEHTAVLRARAKEIEQAA